MKVPIVQKGRHGFNVMRSLGPTTLTETEIIRPVRKEVYPELANQLINQIILQNNSKVLKAASAAPPSGSGKQSLPMAKYDLGHAHVLRGYSFLSSNNQF